LILSDEVKNNGVTLLEKSSNENASLEVKSAMKSIYKFVIKSIYKFVENMKI